MDHTPPTSFPSTGSSGRYAGVARYLASLEMAGSDLETPPGHRDTSDGHDGPRQLVAGAAKPEIKHDDVTHGSDASPSLRLRRQVVSYTSHMKSFTYHQMLADIHEWKYIKKTKYKYSLGRIECTRCGLLRSTIPASVSLSVCRAVLPCKHC